MSTTTINQPAASGSEPKQQRQPVTIALIREKLTTAPGKHILFLAQFLLSFVTLFYLRGIIQFAYNSIFYRLELTPGMEKGYCFAISRTCFEFALLMLFTRRQIVTRVVIMLAMPFYFPIFLFNYQRLELVIPLALLIVITYIMSGTGEGAKTILGAVFLMFYIIGAIVFFLVQSILTPAVSETVIARDVSPLGNYRYQIVQQVDRADGNTYVAMEPNDADIHFDRSAWYTKGTMHEVYHDRPLDTFVYKWDTQTREEITAQLLRINPDTTFTLNADQMRILGLDVGFTEDYKAGALSYFQLKKFGYMNEKDTLTKVMIKLKRTKGLVAIDKDSTLRLTFDQMVDLGLKPTYEMRLADLTDADLAKLGVPEENEILRANGKIVFRQYVAILEDTFSDDNIAMTAVFESNELPEVDEKGLDLDEVRRQREESRAAETTTTTAKTRATEDTSTTTTTTTTAAAALQ